MFADKDEILKLENQICFRLYSASRAFTRAYQSLLEPLGLTYPQYLVMLVLWEKEKLNVKELGKLLQLDSGTLTPVLKRMELQKLIIRERAKEDERVVNISLTESGKKLKEQALKVPYGLAEKTDIEIKDLIELRTLLDKVINSFKE